MPAYTVGSLLYQTGASSAPRLNSTRFGVNPWTSSRANGNKLYLIGYADACFAGYLLILSLSLILFSTIMPAWIFPLPFAQHEDVSDAAGLGDALAAGLQLVRIVRVDHRG